MMITLTRKDNPVFDDFRDQSGEYSTPAVAISAFESALEAHGYRMERRDWGGSTFSMITPYIFDDIGNRVGQAHIAWCTLHAGRYSVIGTLLK
jgi:hypothetical protein